MNPICVTFRLGPAAGCDEVYRFGLQFPFWFKGSSLQYSGVENKENTRSDYLQLVSKSFLTYSVLTAECKK